MNRFGFITNKYIVSAIILLCLLLTDVILHSGMSRVMIPSSFSKKIKPVSLPVCNGPLLQKNKRWAGPVENTGMLQKVPQNTGGILCDVFFDLNKSRFEIYDDSTRASAVSLDSMLAAFRSRDHSRNLWLELKNLDTENVAASLLEMKRLKNNYGLSGSIIVESENPALLKTFCDNGFFTSYLVPFFDPYKATEKELISFADSVRNNLSKYPSSAISGYYFQYPLLKKFFPGYPILTRADNATISVVSFVFRRQLENDESIKGVVFPLED